ncbi:hypothetical protein [Erythrobacter sp. Dej080120_24]|uniref:hypothetical protein n=1 Tax=Erythrobacter sp. Dej080120_24 TaxID=3024837 RepID=UPI0030C6839B
MLGRLKMVFGALALGGAIFAAPSQAQPQLSDLPPEASAYRGFVVMREIDNRCPNLNFGERSTLNDLALGAMMRIPAIANSDIGEMGPQAYFERIEAVSAPIAAEAKSAAIWAPCEEAPRLLGRVKVDVMVSAVAHLQKGLPVFEESATDLQKRVAAALLNHLRQLTANAPQGALEQAVAAQMQQIELTPEQAAQDARRFMSHFAVSSGLANNGYALRWSEAGKGWMLIDTTTRERAGLDLYVEPRIAAYYRQASAPDDFAHFYNGDTRIVMLPRKSDSRVGFIAFPVDASQPLEASEVAVWPRYMSEPKTRHSDFGCVRGAQCFRFSIETGRLLVSRADDSDLFQGARVAVHAPFSPGNDPGPQIINDRTRENQPPVDYLPLREMFAE